MSGILDALAGEQKMLTVCPNCARPFAVAFPGRHTCHHCRAVILVQPVGSGKPNVMMAPPASGLMSAYSAMLAQGKREADEVAAKAEPEATKSLFAWLWTSEAGGRTAMWRAWLGGIASVAGLIGFAVWGFLFPPPWLLVPPAQPDFAGGIVILLTAIMAQAAWVGIAGLWVTRLVPRTRRHRMEAWRSFADGLLGLGLAVLPGVGPLLAGPLVIPRLARPLAREGMSPTRAQFEATTLFIGWVVMGLAMTGLWVWL